MEIKKKMLAADDEPGIIHLLKDYFEMQDYQVIEAENGMERKKPVKICGALTIRYEERCVYIGEDLLGLTKTEYGILELLSLNPGQVFSKEQLYEKVRGYEGDADAGIITEHIRRIRAKISRYTDKAYIETVWGVGYRWIG